MMSKEPTESREAARHDARHADVCVYGGTGAAVTSAIQAARAGRSVLLVSPQSHIGAMHTEGLSPAEINTGWNPGADAAVGGMAHEFFERIARAYGQDGVCWRFEPNVAQRVMDDWLAEHPSVAVLHDRRLADARDAVTVMQGRIARIALNDDTSVAARLFIDATVEGDLLHAAGVSTVVGRESRDQYGESKNGICAETTWSQFDVPVDPYCKPGDPASGTIHTVRDEPLGTPGEADAGVSAYCFRLCLTRQPGNRMPFAPPDDYDPRRYEIYRRYVEAGGRLAVPKENLPNQKANFLGWRALDHNLYGMHDDYPNASLSERPRIVRRLLSFTQGLFYYLANDPGIPASLRARYSEWGVCRDEFTDHAGWPRCVNVRAARRMVSDYVITQHDTDQQQAIAIPDPVAVAYWPPDVHSVRRIVRDGKAYNEGFVIGGDDWRPFGIAYRALIPKANECVNLLTPTCPSSSHIGYGAVRLEWTFMLLGQAVGAAAALALERDTRVQDVSYATLAHRLREAGQVLSLQPADA